MHRLMPPDYGHRRFSGRAEFRGAQILGCLPPLDCRAASPLAMTKRLGHGMETLSSFSLGLDPRVHEIPATSNGCPDRVRASRGWVTRGVPPNPHGEPVEPRGFQHRVCRPSFDRLRMRVVLSPITKTLRRHCEGRSRAAIQSDKHRPFSPSPQHPAKSKPVIDLARRAHDSCSHRHGDIQCIDALPPRP